MGQTAAAAAAKSNVKQFHKSSNPYDDLDKPTVLRNKSENKTESRETRFGAQPAKKETDLDYLDIPAFLRRQAD
jgi:cell division protein FtsZ